MFERISDIVHHLRIMADMHIVIQANQRIRLFINCLDRLSGTNHKRKHLRIAISIVRFEITPTDLPCAEKLRRIVIQRTESIDRSGGQLLPGDSPDLFKSGFQIRLRVVGRPQSDEFAVWFQDIYPTSILYVDYVKPLDI